MICERKVSFPTFSAVKGSFHFTAEKVGKDTFLSQIIKRVQEAQGSKAPVQQLVDKIASVFVPIVIGVAILTFIVWMSLGGDLAFSHGLTTARSEEHTSELQSRPHLVCRLLLEKKNTK